MKVDNGVHGRELPIPDTTLRKQDGGAVDFLIETYYRRTPTRSC